MNIKTIENYMAPGNTFIAEPMALREMENDLYIPDNMIDKSFFKIISLGLKFDHKEFNVGDIVLVNGKGGDRIDIQKGEYWIYPVKMVAAKILDDEVIPINKFVTLIPNKVDEVKEFNGVLIYQENKEEDVLILEVERVGNKCDDLIPCMKVFVKKKYCIPVKTKDHYIYLTSKEVIIALIEE